MMAESGEWEKCECEEYMRALGPVCEIAILPTRFFLSCITTTKLFLLPLLELPILFREP